MFERIIETSLNKIVLINMMRIKHKQIVISGNTHLSGPNGVGKTAFFRLIAYLFSGAQRDALGIDSHMKGFNDFYFRNRDDKSRNFSMLVYEFKVKEETSAGITERYFTITCYWNGTVNFLFTDCPYDENNYIDVKAGNIWESFAITESKLLDTVERDPYRFHKTNSVEEFRHILFGCPTPTTKKPLNMFRKFCFFLSVSKQDLDPKIPEKIISKMLIRIFCPPDKKQDTLNDLMEYLMSDRDNGIIQLSAIRDKIKEYHTQYDAFKTWNGTRAAAARRIIRDNYPVYVSTLEEQRDINGKLKFAYGHAMSEKSILDTQIEILEGALTTMVSAAENEQANHENTQSALAQRIGELGGTINTLNEKHEKYIPIMQRADEFEGLPGLRSQQSTLDGQLQILKAGQKEIENIHNAAVKLCESTYNNYFNGEYAREHQRLLIAVEKYGMELYKEMNETDYPAIDEEFSERRNTLALEIARLENTIEDSRNKLLVIGQYRPQQIQDKIDTWKATKTTAENNSKLKSAERKQVEKEQEKNQERSRTLDQRRDAIFSYRLSVLKTERDKANNELSRINLTIADFNESFAGWLTENKPGWEGTIGQTVRQELLASKELNPASEGDGDLLFGVRIDTEGLSFDVNTLQNLEDKKKEAENKAEQAEKAYQAALDEKEAWTQTEQESIRLEKEKLEADAERLDKEIAGYNTEANEAAVTISQLDAEMRTMREKKRVELTTLLEKSKSSMTLKKTELNTLEKDIQAKKNECKAKIDEEISDYAKTVETEKTKLEETRKQREKDKEDGIRKADETRRKKLESQNIDANEITELEKQSEALATRITNLETERDEYVAAKKFEEEDYINLEIYQQQLKDTKEEKRLENEAHKAYVTKYATDKKKTEDQLEAKNKQRSKNDEDIRKVESLYPQKDNHTLSDIMKARKEAFEAAIPIETKDRCTDIIEKMRTIETILSEKREAISTAISSIWHAFKGNEAARRILFGENDYTDVQFEEKSRFLAMYEYICEDRANTIKQSYQNQALALLSSLNSSNSSWKSYIEEVNRQVSEINSELRQINFISNIRRIEIRSMRRKDSLLDRMSMLPSLEEDARKGGYDFFADQGNRFYRFMDDLDEALMDRKEPTLKAIDAISLQMRIDEGQNTGEWFGTFEPKGSTGTKVFAKNFFYVAILKSLIRKYERANWKARLPLLFDEVGQLTNDYMEQFLIKAKESGFNCMTAQPSTSWNVDLATYDQEYQMTPSEKNPDFVTITEMFKKRNTFIPQE